MSNEIPGGKTLLQCSGDVGSCLLTGIIWTLVEFILMGRSLYCGIIAAAKSTNYSHIHKTQEYTPSIIVLHEVTAYFVMSRLAKAQLWDTVIRISRQITTQVWDCWLRTCLISSVSWQSNISQVNDLH